MNLISPSSSKWNLRKLIVFLIFVLVSFNLSSTPINQKEDLLTIDSLPSSACKYFYHQLKHVSSEWGKNDTKLNALDHISSNELILNSNDIVLFSHQLEDEKLFFTKLKYDIRDELLSEVKYFYSGSFLTLQNDCSYMLNKLGVTIDKLSAINMSGEKIGIEWIEENKKFVFVFKRNEANKKGVLSLLISKFDAPQENTKPTIFASGETITAIPRKLSTKLANEHFADTISLEKSTVLVLTEKSGEIEKENKSETKLIPGTKVCPTSKTSLRTEGKDGAAILARLFPDDPLIILPSDYNYYWTFVRHKNVEGWVKTSLLKR